jgi:hypothetical protein
MSTLTEVIRRHEAAVAAGTLPSIAYRAGNHGQHWAGVPALYVGRISLVRRQPAFADGKPRSESEAVA